MDYNMWGFPVLHYFPEVAHTHVDLGSNAIQTSHHVTPFSSCSQSFPASGSFPMSYFFASGGQSIGALVSASVLPINIQGWFPLGLTGLIPLLSKRLSSLLLHNLKESVLQHSTFFIVQSSIHDYWKTTALIIQTFVGRAMSLLFNMLPRLVIAFLPRNKCLLISWLQ